MKWLLNPNSYDTLNKKKILLKKELKSSTFTLHF